MNEFVGKVNWFECHQCFNILQLEGIKRHFIDFKNPKSCNSGSFKNRIKQTNRRKGK